MNGDRSEEGSVETGGTPPPEQGKSEDPLMDAEDADDRERLRALEELHDSLETELEGDADQEGSSRH